MTKDKFEHLCEWTDEKTGEKITVFEFNRKNNRLYVNGKKILVEKKITLNFWQSISTFMVAVGSFGSFFVTLIDYLGGK